MNIRQRLLVLAAQLGLIALATYFQAGRPYSADPIFLTLVGLAVTPTLEEPWFRSPIGLFAGSVEGLLVVLLVDKNHAYPGWVALGLLLAFSLSIAVVALVFGAGRTRGRFISLGRVAAQLTQALTARVILSMVFAMLLIETQLPEATLSDAFWWPLGTWLGVMAISRTPWIGMLKAIGGQEAACRSEGMVGPNRLLISAEDLPTPGQWVVLETSSVTVDAVVVTRIARPNDVWGELHVVDSMKCELLQGAPSLRLRKAATQGQPLHGAVDVGSTESVVRFVATGPLKIGQVVRVPVGGSLADILYQVTTAAVEQSNVKDGAQLVVRATAHQIGFFDPHSMRLVRHRWVPPPGAPVFADSGEEPDLRGKPATWLLLGHVIGTKIPVFLDLDLAAEGHLAILGMTRMGKSTLALRVAQALASSRRVVILDQTGEYVGRAKLVKYVDQTDWATNGISVNEPKAGLVLPTFARDFLRDTMNLAFKEYQATGGSVTRARTMLVDEAHQFVPEPTSLQYDSNTNDTGRNSAYHFGILVMQIRKYGLSMVLVSQRTAVVAKSALSQCENLIAFRSVDHTGVDYLEAIAGQGVRTLVPSLGHGEALVFGPAITAENPVAIAVSK